MSKKANIDMIHQAAQKLCEVVEKFGGNRAMVCWGFTSLEDDECVTGITLSNDLNSSDLKALIFQLNGRAYYLTKDNNLEDSPTTE